MSLVFPVGLVFSAPNKHDVEVSVINDKNENSTKNESYPNILAGKLLDGMIKFLHLDEIPKNSDEKSNFTVEISNGVENISNTANIISIDTAEIEMPSIDIYNGFLETSNITNNGFEVLENIESMDLLENSIRNERMVDYDSFSK